MSGRGREVADAYIDVHGDLSKFRRSMDKEKPKMRKVGEGYADAFTEAFERRADAKMDKIWNDLFDASSSGKAMDWDKVFGNFDTKNLDEALEKTKEYLKNQREAGNLTEKQFADLAEQAKKASKIIQNEDAALAKHNEEVRKGIIARREAMRRHELQLKSASQAWDDMEKFVKEANAEIAKMENDKLREHNRLIKEGSDLRKRAALAESALRAKQKAAQQEAIEELKRFNNTYEGMLINAEDDRITRGMRKLAEFMAGADLGPNRKSEEAVARWRSEMTFAAESAKEMGRIGSEEFDRVSKAIKKVTPNLDDVSKKIDDGTKRTNIFKKAASGLGTAWKRMDDDVRVIIGLIVASAGPMAAGLSGVAASLTAVVSSAAMAAAAVVPLASAFAGLGVGVALAVSGFEDMVKRFPGIKTQMEGIGNVWEAQAARFGTAWGPAFESFLGAFSKQLASVDFGTALGKSFATITGAFEKVVSGAGFTAFMKAMGNDIPAAVAGIGTGLAGVTDALMNLLAGAAPVAKLLGEDFARWGTELGKVAEKARESGKMNEVFMLARDSLKSVLDLAGSLGKALGAVFMAGAESGNRLLDSLTGVIDKFTAWTQTVEGKNSLEEWFSNGERIIKSFEPLLVGLAGFFDNLVTDRSISQFETLMKTVGDFLPVLGKMLGVVSDLGIFNLLADALAAVGSFIEPMLPSLSKLASVIGDGVSGAIRALSPLLGALGAAFAPVVAVVADVAARVFPAAVAAIQTLVPVLQPIISVVGKVVSVIANFLVPLIGDVLIGVFNNIVGVVQGVMKVFQGLGTIFEGIKQLFSGDFAGGLATMWEGVKQVFSGALQAIWNIVQLWIVGKIGGIIKGFLGPLGKLFGDAFKKIGPAISGAFTAVMGAIGRALMTAFTFITSNLGRLFTGIGNIARSFISGFAALWNGLVSIFRAIWTMISTIVTEVFTALISTVRTGSSGIVQIISTVWNGLVQIVRTIFGAIVQVIQTVWVAIRTVIVNAWNGIVAFIQPAVTMWANVFRGIWNGIASFIRTVWNGISSFFQTIFTAIGSFFSTVWTGISTALSVVMNGMRSVITTVWNAVKGFFGVVLNGIKATFSTVWNAIKSAVTSVVNAIKSVITTVFNAVKSFLTPLLNGIKSTFSTVWNAIKSVVSTVVNAIKSVISSVFNAIKWIINRILNGFKNIFTSVFNAIRNIVNNVMNAIRNVISNIMNAIRSKFGGVWGAIKGIVSNAINSVRSTISNVINSVRSIISGVLSSIRSTFSNAWNNIKSTVSNAFSSIRNTVSNGINNVMGFIRSLPGKIRGALSGLGGLLSGAGRAIMDGLLGGLKRAWNGVKNFVGGVADWIRNNKGPISYDRKLLIPAGNAIMEGLGKGLEAMLPKLKGKLDIITGTMANALSSKKLTKAADSLATTAVDAMGTSKLYLAGRNAADQLANGLKDGRRGIEAAMAGLGPDGLIPDARLVGSVHTARAPQGQAQAPAGATNQFNEGAIQVITPAQDARVVASQMLDEFTRHVGG